MVASPEPVALHSLPSPAAAGISPRVQEALARRGVSLARLPDETGAVAAERLDTALMALFRDTRDGEAFESLYRHSRGSVFEWVGRLIRERRARVDPLEICQDTFVNAYRYSRRFRDESPSSFRVWVRTIAANCLRRALGSLPRGGAEDDDRSPRDTEDLRPGPLSTSMAREERRALALSWLLFLEHYAMAFDALGPRDRIALTLIEIEGLSYAEAAKLLKVGSSNMKMIMFRSRQRIQRGMRRAMGDAEVRSDAPRASALASAG